MAHAQTDEPAGGGRKTRRQPDDDPELGTRPERADRAPVAPAARPLRRRLPRRDAAGADQARRRCRRGGGRVIHVTRPVTTGPRLSFFPTQTDRPPTPAVNSRHSPSLPV